MKARFLQGSLYSAGGMVYATLGMLAAGKLLTNTLSTEAVGEFALLLLCAEFLATLANLGLNVTLPKLLQSREGEAQESLLSSVFTLQLVVALALSAGVMVAAIFGPLWLPLVAAWLPLPRALLAILPVVLIAAALRDFLLAAAAGQHAYGQRAAAIALIATLQVIFFGALYAGQNEAPLPFVVSNLFAVTAGTTMLARTMPRPQPADWALAWGQVRFSVPLFINNLLNFIYQRLDTLLVIYFLGLGTGALFEMAKRIPAVLTRFFGAVLIPYLPSVSEILRGGDQARAGSLLNRVAAMVAFTGYGMTLIAVVVQAPLLHALFSEEYSGATPALGPLLIAACLSVQAGIYGQALIALERPRYVMIINTGMALISVGLNVVLVPRFGLAGAGWSAVVAALFSCGLQRWVVGRAGMKIHAGRALLIPAFFAAAYALLLRLEPTFTVVVGALALYGIGVLATGAIPVREAASLFQRPKP